jgi:HPt (histidine-containing phosphotransfer) domain-containing protein
VEQLGTRRADLGSREAADALFRAMHSLKGAARYLEFKGIERVSHSVEEIIAACRDQGRPPSGDESARLDELVDSIRAETGTIRQLNERFRSFAVAQGGAEASYRELMSSLKRMALDIGGQLRKNVSFRAFGTLEDRDLASGIRYPPRSQRRDHAWRSWSGWRRTSEGRPVTVVVRRRDRWCA